MNRVIIINLNGNAYQLEESGYDALRTYLDNAARRLEGNPDKAEIIADIEQAIADKFRTVLGANKNVVMTKEVESVLLEMGPVQDGNQAGDDQARASENSAKRASETQSDADSRKEADSAAPGSVKRLYTIKEGAMLAGVCNGLAVYFNIDVTIVRLLFVILTLFWGTGALVYLLMAFIVPTANTPAEKAAAYGAAATAQEFIRRAKEGYYEGMKSFHDKDARREWKRKFKQDMRGWQRGFQNEINRNARQWQHNWQNHWAQPPHAGFGAAWAPPFFWLINGAITVVAIFAIYSLVKTGMVFGLVLPEGIPLWVGIVALIIIWQGVTWPFKAMTWYSCHSGGYRGRCSGPFGALGDFLFGIAVIALVFWLADHYIPQFHEAMKQLPPLLHQAVDSVQCWLERH
jgi:phage shock protein PspC (stress-responsive transcriptional regulator)